MDRNYGFAIILMIIFIEKHYCLPDPLNLNENHKTKLTEHFVKYGINCLSNHTITLDDVKALKAFEMPKGPDAPCFFACILKATNMMDENGKIDPEAVLSAIETVFEDKNEMNEVVAVFQACAYVNNNNVSDGNRGCDRAKLALSCIMEKSKIETNGRIEAHDDSNGSGSTVAKKRNFVNIISVLIRSLKRMACVGISRDHLPGVIVSMLIPGANYVHLFQLCTFSA